MSILGPMPMFRPVISPQAGNITWGHHTNVEEDYSRNFSGKWNEDYSLIISGTGDSEKMEFEKTVTTLNEPWNCGAGVKQIIRNKYSTDSTSVGPSYIYYKTGKTKSECESALWVPVDFNGNFTSLGWVSIFIADLDYKEEVIIDELDAGFSKSLGWVTATSTAGYLGHYFYTNGTELLVNCTWETENVHPEINYDVYGWWAGGGTSRSTAVNYVTYNDTTSVASINVNQQQNHGQWNLLAENVKFTTRIAKVTIPDQDGAASKICADAVRFLAKSWF